MRHEQCIELTYLKATGYCMNMLSTHFDHGTGVMEINEGNLLYHMCQQIDRDKKYRKALNVLNITRIATSIRAGDLEEQT